ncbi:hypothetical protein [[Clostridium] hylemonae]|uniref:Uncharacterized protein n=1 Tax=[Clostridium] hylemonae DSM 15053 TaxID=553973 RepID=C0BX85_9FIRM|nr:hypothetical protein [[Clostridium] hylemonae]EEG75493.1 hypothetical protein CLOHYLEM_04422 [[Clostridium] hylemonae DSM 15053]MCB7521558.1 hypothetical protein [[Clostridium] hylemonae]QEK18033.1 hypothetical protein LAJLEIBI_02048 [[Clostridium] hylemonae DSM 15053]BDF05054.1 hypothetical protein CE91St63_21160 [[Clostridium] hylemonae]
MNNSDYVKVLGVTFDALEGLTVVAESNVKDLEDAGRYAAEHDDGAAIWICVPCRCDFYRIFQKIK